MGTSVSGESSQGVKQNGQSACLSVGVVGAQVVGGPMYIGDREGERLSSSWADVVHRRLRIAPNEDHRQLTRFFSNMPLMVALELSGGRFIASIVA